MNFTEVQLRQQVLEHPLSAKEISAFAKAAKVKEDDVVERLALFLIQKFGLFYQEQIVVVVTHEGLKRRYLTKFTSVLRTFHLLSAGKIDDVRQQALAEMTAFSAETPDEVFGRVVRDTVVLCPMPVPLAYEWRLRHNISLPMGFTKELSRREERIAGILYKILDERGAVAAVEEAEDVERFLFSDCCLVRDGEYVTWMTVVDSWASGCSSQVDVTKKLPEVTRFRQLVCPPKDAEAAASPAAPRDLSAFENKDSGLVEVPLGPEAHEVDRFYGGRGVGDSTLPPFRDYVMREMWASVSKANEVEIPQAILELLHKYFSGNETARKFVSYFAHSPHLRRLDFSKSGGGFEHIFVEALQRFLNFRDRILKPQQVGSAIVRTVHPSTPLIQVLEWAFFAPSHWRSQLGDELPLDHVMPAFEAACNIARTGTVKAENGLELFIRVCLLKDPVSFKRFTEVVIDNRIFPMDQTFALEFLKARFEPEDFAPVFSACRQIDRLLRQIKVDAMPALFWVDVCTKLSLTPDLEGRVSQFLDRYQNGNVKDKNNFHYFLIRFFGQEMTPEKMHLIQTFEKLAGRQLEFADIVDLFAAPLSPLKAGYEEDIPFCVEQLEALGSCGFSNAEAGRLFYDFLSVPDRRVIETSILWLSLIEELTAITLPKNIVLAWLHYRPSRVQVEEMETTIGQQIQYVAECRQAIVHRHLDRPVIPYSMTHLLHQIISCFSGEHARPTDAHRIAEDDYEVASQYIMTSLGLATLSFNAQLFSEAVSREALDTGVFYFEDSRAAQRMDSICPIFPNHPFAIYRSWSRPQNETSPLNFHLVLMDTRTMRSWSTCQVLDIPSKIIYECPEVIDVIHQAAVIMGEERNGGDLIDEAHLGFRRLFARYPKLEAAWMYFKQTSVTKATAENAIFEFIEYAKSEDVGIDADMLAFEVALLLYPRFAKIWDEFEVRAIKDDSEQWQKFLADVAVRRQVSVAQLVQSKVVTKEQVALVIHDFVFGLKVAFRKGLLHLANAIPPNYTDLLAANAHDLACCGQTYSLPEDGLSLLPPLRPYCTDTMFKRYALPVEDYSVVIEVTSLAKGGMKVENRAVAFKKGAVDGPLIVDFDPIPQGREKVPLNQVTLTLRGIPHVVRYAHLVQAANFHSMVRWHILTLLAKVLRNGN
jgi:hypothetical protein